MIHTLCKLSGGGHDVIAEYDPDTTSPERLAEIEREFNALMDQGYFAADITHAPERTAIVKQFDPNADLLLLPKVQGG